MCNSKEFRLFRNCSLLTDWLELLPDGLTGGLCYHNVLHVGADQTYQNSNLNCKCVIVISPMQRHTPPVSLNWSVLLNTPRKDSVTVLQILNDLLYHPNFGQFDIATDVYGASINFYIL